MKNIRLLTGFAGLFTISWEGKEDWEETNIHFFPHKEYRTWGKKEYWFDGPCYEFGLGPFLLITWT